MKKIRTGAASFYIVAFSTLFLTIIALGFATIVISEVNRTINSDLSQSAYDSALAGVEDAKVAILNYQSCLNQGYDTETTPIITSTQITCGEIIYYMNHPDCDMVGHILGRIPKDQQQEVQIKETIDGKNNMEQAYTCVKIATNLHDYRATHTSASPAHILPITVDNPDEINAIKISWYSDTDGTEFKYSNVNNNGIVTFPALTASQVATPPTIAVELVQTAIDFRLIDLDISRMSSATYGTTDHGMLYFVPTDKTRDARGFVSKSNTTTTEANAVYYNIATNTDKANNVLKMSDEINFATSGDKTSKKSPVALYCPMNSGNEFACSVSIELPRPNVGVDGDQKRNKDTFMLILSIPYNQPDTDFSIELCRDSGCSDLAVIPTDPNLDNRLDFGNMQIRIDSTGRANNLYRRVETRLENFDTYMPLSSYAIQLTGNGTSLVKDIVTDAEHSYDSYRFNNSFVLPNAF